MNKLALICAFALFSLPAQTQSIQESEAPVVVVSKLKSIYPKVSKIKWDMEDGLYEASFTDQKIETSVLFSSDATLLQTETEVEISSLPSAISEYVVKHHPLAKISEACKIVDMHGTISYEVEVGDTDFLFSPTGQLMGQEEDDDEDEDEK